MDNYNISLSFPIGYDQESDLPPVKVLQPHDFEELFSGKKVVFITTKNIDYIRNVQEIKLLKQYAAQVKIISSARKTYIARIFTVYRQILFTSFKKFDCVFVGFSPQLICPVWGWKLGSEMIVDFFISVYDTLVNDRKIFRKSSIFARLCHWIDRFTIKSAGCILTDTIADARYFMKEFYGSSSKFETLYLAADTTIYYPQEPVKNPKLHDKYVVLYFGSILPLQGVNIVLDAVSLLKDRSDIHIQIIGPVSTKYSKPIQANVEYIDWLSQKELSKYIAAADLCLAGHFNSKIDKAARTIPGKAYIYHAMNKDMLLGDNAANRELFTENAHTAFVPMGNAFALKDAIIRFCNNAKKR